MEDSIKRDIQHHSFAIQMNVCGLDSQDAVRESCKTTRQKYVASLHTSHFSKSSGISILKQIRLFTSFHIKNQFKGSKDAGEDVRHQFSIGIKVAIAYLREREREKKKPLKMSRDARHQFEIGKSR